ncbi:MAG TPA: immunoglobulin-like domain-containing protein [Pyrinomonadaceae bacterium]|nr:immunoglobulin-like domain-containing protein [Pyrinomonadaceae bacterium]
MSDPILAKTIADKKVSATIKGHKPAAQKRETSSPFVEASQYLALLPLQLGAETISTYASNCTTPKTDFDLGDTVCLKLTGATSGSSRVNWVARTGAVVQSDNITTGPQTFTFTLPTSSTSTVSGIGVDDVSADNRGVWRVYTAAGDNSVRTVASFTVHAPTPFVDLSTYQSAGAQGTSVSAGSSSAFDIYVTNNGPDAAQSVQVVDTLPANTTLVSIGDDASAFTCGPASGGTVTCTANSLASGTTAKFTLVYSVDDGTPADTVLTNNVAVSSTTEELEPGDNSSTFNAKVPASAGAQTCTLGCRDDLVVTANTTQNGNRGAVVNFTTTNNISGNCGAISSNPASGSFFPVGTTVVSVVSETGGGSCSFTIMVTETAAPTISCPPDKTATADQNGTATVDAGTPTTTPSTGVTVTALRSDGLELSDPYPTGVTNVTWTVKDSDGRTASCTQKITVTADCAGDTTPPTITAPANITIGTGADSASCGVALDDELGQPTADDDCSVIVTTTGIPAGNFFPIGQTTITYTATDPAGHTATATQTVTVTDDTPPVIFAPADASYTCLSEVPAASPSQATGADIIVNGQPQPGPPSDNCGTPTVTITENSSGAGSASSPRVITRTFTATDSHGNSTSSTQTITVIDSTPPTITLNGASSITVECHTGFTDPGATASDNCASSVAVTSSGTVNANAPGTYTITYNATDAAGNPAASKTRTVTVVDTTPPTLTLNGASSLTVECHTSFTDPGATANDGCAGNLTGAITVTGSVNANVVGNYTLTYSVSDGSNTTTATRAVHVVDTTKPTITINGANPMTVECHTSFTDPGASANDACAGPVPVTAANNVNVNVPGSYAVTYTATDAVGNTQTATRTVNVVDTTEPAITLSNLTIFFNDLTIVFNSNTVIINGTTYPFNGVSFTHGNRSFSFNGQTITVTISGHAFTYTLNGKTLTLWTPTHQYQTVKVADLIASAGDSCDSNTNLSKVTISQVTSDEVDDAPNGGDGNTVNDIVIAPDCKSVQLRAERDGNSNGRVYTVTFRVRDAAGNAKTVTSKINVPASSWTVVDSGPHKTVTGNCP